MKMFSSFKFESPYMLLFYHRAMKLDNFMEMLQVTQSNPNQI